MRGAEGTAFLSRGPCSDPGKVGPEPPGAWGAIMNNYAMEGYKHLCTGAAGNPRVPRLLPGTLGNFPGCL